MARTEIRRHLAAYRRGHDVPDEVRLYWSRRARYAAARARALALPRADVVGACRQRWRSTRCGCGIVEMPVGCDQPQLCAWCAARLWKRWRRRISKSMRAKLRAEVAQWAADRRGRKPGIYMVTLTGPHSGDVRVDRERLGKAWRALYNHANARGWWATYAATYEVTTGTDGDGHVHLHVAVIARWIPYEELHVTWRKALPGALVLDVQAPKTKRGQRRTNAAGAASEYLASYITKGVDVATMTGALAARVVLAFRRKRKVTTSAHFWNPLAPRTCPVCGLVHRGHSGPLALGAVRPGALIKAQAEQLGVWLPRGPTQSTIEHRLTYASALASLAPKYGAPPSETL